MAELDTVSPVVWPKWCYTNTHPESDSAVVHPSICKVPTISSTKARRKKSKAVTGTGTGTGPSSGPNTGPSVKNERCSPDTELGTESSRSDSPHSPGSGSSFFRTRTPHSLTGTGTPPNPAFTPPERFSPAGYAQSLSQSHSGSNSIKVGNSMEGLHMSRNYSDYMRSLAAKYNNSNPNEYRAANGYPSAMDRFSGCKASAGGYALLPQLNPLAAKKDDPSPSPSKKDKRIDVDSVAAAHPLCLPNLMAAMNPAAMSSFPMIDMSSTQALLNIVRSASAQNAQQLETYLRSNSSHHSTASSATSGATKRPRSAEAAPAPASHAPLDLSAPLAKRPYIDASAYPFSSFKSVIEMESLVASGGKKSPAATAAAAPRSTPPALMPVISPRPLAALSERPTKALPLSCRLTCAADACNPAATQVQLWTIADVVNFVKTIDLCHEYAEVFREHSIDGCTLPLLTEEHLMSTMNMKLGPALKLRSVLAKKIGHCAVCLHCVHCHSERSTSPSGEHNSADE